MSYKATAFSTAYLGPQFLNRFAVYIPHIYTSPLFVSSASLPSETHPENKIFVSGQPLRLPSRLQVPGSWVCTLEENMISSSAAQLRILKEKSNLDSSVGFFKNTHKLDKRLNVKLQDIYIFLLDSATGLIPVNGCLLKYAWLQSIEPVQLNASSTDVLKWKLTFSYSSIVSIL